MSWSTKITDVDENRILIRGYRHEQIVGTIGFAQTVFLLLRGELPDAKSGRMMDAILTACVDHGVSPPSALAARTAASGGIPLPSAVAAGILAIGDAHGGAIEESARILQEAVEKSRSTAGGPERLVAELRDADRRIPGFGHRLHTSDPRAVRLLSLAEELGLAGAHVALAQAIEHELETTKGKRLPINVDGAIAAVISDMGFDWKLGKAFFVIGRVAGLAAHVYEEQTTQKPMRRVSTTDDVYDGPVERPLP